LTPQLSTLILSDRQEWRLDGSGNSGKGGEELTMIRSFAFTTQGKLHSKDVEAFLMPTLLADTNLFLWVDLEKATPEEIKLVLEDIFHFHPLSIEDCVTASPSPKVEAYNPKDEDKFSPYLFMVI